MLHLTDRAGVAGRITEILRNQQLSIEEAAARLRFDPFEVRAALDGDITLSMIIAVVRSFGIDPMWLLTGEYQQWSHNASLEDPFTAVYDVLRRLDQARDRWDGDANESRFGSAA